MRKIIQIATDAQGTIYALCNDGSIWWYKWHEALPEDAWKILHRVPQDKVEDDPRNSPYWAG